jgi:hypothetical protein
MQQQKIPTGVIIGAVVAIVALAAFIGTNAAKKSDDTQGVVYGGSPEGYAKRMKEQGGRGNNMSR